MIVDLQRIGALCGCPLMSHMYVMGRVRSRIMDWRDIEDPKYEEHNRRDEKQDQT